MLSAYADEHIRAVITEGLRRRGMDVVTVQERQGEGTEDPEVLTEALRDQRVLLTNDTDFLALAARCQARGEVFAPIFFWPQSRRRAGDIIRRVISEASQTDYANARSRVFFL